MDILSFYTRFRINSRPRGTGLAREELVLHEMAVGGRIHDGEPGHRSTQQLTMTPRHHPEAKRKGALKEAE